MTNCEWPHCWCPSQYCVLGIHLCHPHRQLLENHGGEVIRKLVNDLGAVATEGGPVPLSVNGVTHHERDS